MPKESAPKTVYLEEYRPPAYLIDTVDLVFYLYEETTRVRSKLTLHSNPDVSGETPALRLAGEMLEPVWVRLNGGELSSEAYRVDEGGLTLLNPPDQFVLETEVEISPDQNTALEGLYRSGGMFCTQCEAEGFRRISWFLDQPDVMARFRVRIEAEEKRYPVLLSNGNPMESGMLPAGRHYAVWEDPYPKPSYLFALVAGDLRFIEDSYRTASGREVRLRIYVEPENIDKCDHAMRSLVSAMAWDEEKYGREYDLDVYNIVAVNDFNMGAMENKGLNVFNSRYVLAGPETATDHDYQGIEGVIGHEYFHNWTGNRITCRDWFQLSLKEGLTVYRDQEFSADMGSRGVKRIEDVRLLRSRQFAEDAGPMAHPVRPASYIEINNFYTATVYEKGAEVVRMQASLLGPERYRAATDLFFDRYDGQAVTTDDFVACMEEASGRDLSQFKHWYDYAGTPEIKAGGRYDPLARTFTLTLQQEVKDTPGQTDKPAYHIPFVLGLLDHEGQDIPLKSAALTRDDGMLELTEKEHIVVFENVPVEPVPSLLRGFSAPVNVTYSYSDQELMFLMARDSDDFNRWNAAQVLAQNLMLDMLQQDRAGQGTEVPAAFVENFRDTLLADDADTALLAEVLALPSESDLGDQMKTVDVDGIHRVREAVRNTLAREVSTDLFRVYGQLTSGESYQISAEAMGRRKLKNLLLSYLVAGGSEDAARLCITQYRQADNMTDSIAALALLANSNLPERDEALADFAQRWRQDPLVMDKWFSVQAVSSNENVLAHISGLLQHPGFSIRNPNKVHALIGSFVVRNPLRFHAVDGSGYAFLADRILEIDPFNPQVAARLARSLSRWQHYDAQRQEEMRAQLERIVGKDGLSRDVYEVVSKSLED